MSVIGYLRRCTQCDVQMLVTVDYKHGDWCTQCLDEAISEAIDADAIDAAAGDDDDYPLGQVTA